MFFVFLKGDEEDEDEEQIDLQQQQNNLGFLPVFF